MQLLTFTQPGSDLSAAYSAHHSTSLVVLSLFIAMLASFASFNHVELIRQQHSKRKVLQWLLLGAFAMGSGVWAMHFIGMISYLLPIEVSYHSGLTLLSILPAVLAGFVTLKVISRPTFAWPQILLGGVLMGAGIGTMHYLGMGAMILKADRLYNPSWFAVSIAIAILLATLALGIRPLLSQYIKQRTLLNILASIVMGLAVASMHYVAMHATVFLPQTSPSVLADGHSLDSQALITIAVATAILIVLIATVVVIMRYRLLGAEQRQHAAMAQARNLEARMHIIAERVPGLVYEFRMAQDGSMSFPYVSDAIEEIYGISAEQAQQDAQILQTIIHQDDLSAVYSSIAESARTMKAWQAEYRVIKPGSTEVRWLFGSASPSRERDGAVSWSGVISDITEQKKHSETVHRLAFYDTLTGMPNRRLIQQRLTEHMQQATDSQRVGTVIACDLDNFKRLNDTRGHAIGDELLIQVSKRIDQATPSHCVVGRLSSDEFVVIVTGLSSTSGEVTEQVQAATQRILSALNEPFILSDSSFNCAVSMGICLFPQPDISSEEVLKRADIAMYAGGNQWCMFDPDMQARLQHRYALEQALPKALDSDQLRLALQPQLNSDNEVYAAEALLRWRHPEFGAVSPAEFIPLAEENGFIVPLGQWVIRQACLQLQQWQSEPGFESLQLAVNISARQFYQPDFVAEVSGLITEFSIQHNRLVLELTESLILEDRDEAVERMQTLKALGVRFSMDDFGTGFSSLSYLAQLPFDEVKIDQEFIRAIVDNENARELIIVEAIIQLADKLGMAVIAEGVETATQCEALRTRGCFAFQGFYFAKPLTTDEFFSFVSTHTQTD